MPDDILRDISRHHVVSRRAMKDHLHSLWNAKPRFTMLESQCRHRVISNARREYAQGTINRSVRVAADDNLARCPHSVLNDDVMETAVSSIEQIRDSVFGGEPSHLMQRPGSFFRRRRKIVIEHKGDARWVEDGSPAEFFSKYPHVEISAQVLHVH